VGKRVVEVEGACTVELRDGRIARNLVFFDRSALLDALRSAAPPPDETPRSDPARHLDADALAAGALALAAAPRDAGRLALIVRRLASGARETPPEVRLSLDEGVPGDAWSRRPPRKPEAQLAVMRRDVAELLANGQPLTLFGDQLFVELDVSAPNLPPGTRLRVGEALVEMTAEPHDGCRKFRERFGADALRFVQAKPTRDRNFRGVYWRIVEPGVARVGDAIRVVARP
jgi:hypothetical protein